MYCRCTLHSWLSWIHLTPVLLLQDTYQVQYSFANFTFKLICFDIYCFSQNRPNHRLVSNMTCNLDSSLTLPITYKNGSVLVLTFLAVDPMVNPRRYEIYFRLSTIQTTPWLLKQHARTALKFLDDSWIFIPSLYSRVYFNFLIWVLFFL